MTTIVGGREYTFWVRNLLATVVALLERVGDKLEIPSLRNPNDEISALWHGSRYQELLQIFLESGGNIDTDLLVPLQAFSGTILACFTPAPRRTDTTLQMRQI